MTTNSFSPYAKLAGVSLATDVPPIFFENALYYEVLGSDYWLVAAGQKFYVADSYGVRRSEEYWEPCSAVMALSGLG